MASFSDLFKLGKEILKAETFVLHEAETRGADEGMYHAAVVCARAMSATATHSYEPFVDEMVHSFVFEHK